MRFFRMNKSITHGQIPFTSATNRLNIKSNFVWTMIVSIFLLKQRHVVFHFSVGFRVKFEIFHIIFYALEPLKEDSLVICHSCRKRNNTIIIQEKQHINSSINIFICKVLDKMIDKRMHFYRIICI